VLSPGRSSGGWEPAPPAARPLRTSPPGCFGHGAQGCGETLTTTRAHAEPAGRPSGAGGRLRAGDRRARGVGDLARHSEDLPPVEGERGHEASGAAVRLAALKRRERDAWEALYAEAFPRLASFAYRRLHDAEEARDVANETMARAAAGIDRCSLDARGVVPWLFGICRNVVADALRARYRAARVWPQAMPGQAVAGTPSPDEEVVDAERRDQLRAALHRLSPEEREIVELRLLEGLDSQQVAAIVHKRAGTVRMAQMRALAKLRAALGTALVG
jgi:RNA polymerase sigma-70 factor (ECF subfamily)